MNKIILILSIITSIFITSCGSGDKNVSLKPKTTQLKGDLADYFEVVDKEYKIPIAPGSFNQIITVEVKRKDKDYPFNTDKITPFGVSKEGGEYHVGFGIELLGDNGAVQINNATEGGMGGAFSSDDVTSLFKLKKGETGYIRWSVNKTDGINSFQLTSAIEKVSNAPSAPNAPDISSTTEKKASSGSQNWDNVLNDYDKYVDEYIKFYKKAIKGDQSALSEYPALMQKATDLQTTLAKAQQDNNLSVAQVSRMSNIAMKLVQASQQTK